MVTWSDPAYEAIVQTVHEVAGLVFSPGRRAAVEETILRVMSRAGIRDIPSFAGLVRAEAGLRDELLAELTVGETYFFREAEQFEFLRREVVPELLRARADDQPLRIWSAGCASGEEPYSLAILFERLGLAHRARILGTDLSPRRLEMARRGRYGQWSFRGVPTEIIFAYFNEHGGTFELVPRIRDRVEFRWFNLAGEGKGSPDAGIGEFDLIFCRNVMIYFDPETIAAVAHRLVEALAEDGWLFLGAADPLLAEYIPCTVISTGSGIAYRRAGPEVRCGRASRRTTYEPPPPAPPSQPVLEPPADPALSTDSALSTDPDFSTNPVLTTDPALSTDFEDSVAPSPPNAPQPAASSHGSPRATESARWSEAREAYLRGGYEEVVRLARRLIASGEVDEEGWVLLVRALANQGQLEEAGRVCAGALDRYRLSAELLCIHSVLLNQAGRHREASAAARRALYLDRSHIMAHLALAGALERLGEGDGARRSLENALRHLLAMPPDAVVPASDGQLTRNLAGMVRVRLRLLKEVN